MFRFLTFIFPLLLFAGNLSAQAPATAEDIRGPKAMVAIPQPEKPNFMLWLGIGGGVLLVIIIWLLWKKLRSGKKLKSAPEIALASLAELESQHEALATEAFAIRAAQTVRIYLAGRFGLAAPRRTTEEFFNDLTSQTDSPLHAHSDQLCSFLKSCDLAKFAGSNLDSTHRGELLKAARDFITATADNSTPAP